MLRPWLLCVAAGIAIVASVESAPQRPAFHTAAAAVAVDVVVRDRHGDPVVGLGQTDFELYEDGNWTVARGSAWLHPRRRTAARGDSARGDDARSADVAGWRRAGGGVWRCCAGATRRVDVARQSIFPRPRNVVEPGVDHREHEPVRRPESTRRVLRGSAFGEDHEVGHRDNWLEDNRREHFLKVLDLARRQHVAFYTFDAAGLRAQSPSAAATFGSEPYVALKMLADETGGRYVESTNDLTVGMRRVAEDLRHYYLLGYTSTNTARGGSVRELRVKVLKKGLTVAHRRSYRAPSPDR
jgi:hypothetical protein